MGELGRSLLYAQPVIAESETFSSRPLGTAANAVVADAASRLKAVSYTHLTLPTNSLV